MLQLDEFSILRILNRMCVATVSIKRMQMKENISYATHTN